MQVIPAILATGSGCAAALCSWGAVAPSSQLFGPTVRHTGDASSLALTFDDGPNPAITPALLGLLARYKIRATFFLIGQRARKSPELVREIGERGHLIGNHTHTHPALPFLSPQRIAEELDRCDEAIGHRASWMRPPYGFRGPQLDATIRRRGCGTRVAMWSVAAWDWKPQPAEPVIKRLCRARGGDIVLLHDGDHRAGEGDRRHTLAALEYWLPRWVDAGLRFVSLSDCKEQN